VQRAARFSAVKMLRNNESRFVGSKRGGQRPELANNAFIGLELSVEFDQAEMERG
jgi:hypothetical protein